MNKKFIALLFIPLILLGGIFFLFSRFYNNDVAALTNFSAAYKKFDQAISDFSGPVFGSNLAGAPAAGDFERKADEALVDLNGKASVRVSSLIKNDADLMRTTLEIAALSAKEFDALKAYQAAVADKHADLDQLAKVFSDLSSQRKTAYGLFQELSGQ